MSADPKSARRLRSLLTAEAPRGLAADGRVATPSETADERRFEGRVLVEIATLDGEVVALALASGADAVLLTGIRDGRDLAHLGALLAVAEARAGRPDGATGIVAALTTARGLLDPSSLIEASPRLAGVAWDAEALAADIGAATLRDVRGGLTGPLTHARSLTLLIAAAAGVPAIDTASAAVGSAFADEAREALRDGFAAKFARDADQLRILGETTIAGA